MRIVKICENEPCGSNGLAELKQHVIDGMKSMRNGILSERKGGSGEQELIIVDDDEDSEDKCRGDLVQSQVEVHRFQPQPQARVVRWERFLPVRSLKVLLVENDDSTRHVVSALLRNCGYEVTAVPNGLEAWKILENLNYQIDLVLTEVFLPGLSGIGLLSKIMSHRSRCSIPTIMMSSHDSMGMVLKCFSKGAADFLVKPIRKNELKNLWQHVWRKCYSSSGSGSESAVRTEKSVGAKNDEGSNNGTRSNDEDDTRSVGLQFQDGSDNGSGTQSSWTKRVAEVESPHPTQYGDQLASQPVSNCAQIIYQRPEAVASSWVPVPLKEHMAPGNQQNDISMGKDLEIGIIKNSGSHYKEPNKVTLESGPGKNQLSQLNLKIDGRTIDKRKLEFSNENPEGEWNKQIGNSSGDNIGNVEHERGSLGSEIPTANSKIGKSKDDVMENAEDFSLELSLKRPRVDADTVNNTLEPNILRHSELSAFMRYNTRSTAHHGQKANVGGCSSLDGSSEAAKQSTLCVPNRVATESSRAQVTLTRARFDCKGARAGFGSKISELTKVELGLGIGCNYLARSSDAIVRPRTRLNSARRRGRKKLGAQRVRSYEQHMRQVRGTEGMHADS